jgi:peptidoglycan/xylan/chitin deacetylase (PgdA/CDA1 family)
VSSTDALKASLDVLHYSGATRLLRRFTQGQGAIFCLHHVCPGGGRNVGFAPNHQLEISPEFLDATLTHLTAAGYEFLSIGAAVEKMQAGGSQGRPFAVLTLDDGYKDNLIYAAPIFRKHNCPYTIYVTPKIAEGTCELWWRVLEQVIGGGDGFDGAINGVQTAYATRTIEEKNNAARKLFPIIKTLPEHEQRRWIRDVALQRGIDVNGYCRSVAMTWDEIRGINSDPLCTIGAHTVNHFAVARLDEDESFSEQAQSKAMIEAEINEEVAHFAYPYGDEPAAGVRDFKLAQKAGYTSAVTTRKGLIFSGHEKHLFALPRVMVSGRYQEIRYLDALISGVPFALLNKFRQINVT